MPQTGVKTKYIFVIINHNITLTKSQSAVITTMNWQFKTRLITLPTPHTTAENGFLGLCKRICLSVGAKLCRSRLWLALFIYFFGLFSLVFSPSPLRQNAGGRSVDN